MIEALGNSYEYPIQFGNTCVNKVNSKDSIFLEEKFEQIQDEQGILGKFWNGVKEFTDLGQSASDCEEMLYKFNKGEISFEEAVEYLEQFEQKQENMTSLLSNILTGAAAIAMATPCGAVTATGTKAISWGLAFAKGAPVGAALKAGINFTDRATNDIEGDALDRKQIAKDFISGAITGTTSAVSGASSIGYKSLVDGGKIAEGTLGASVIKGAMCGMQCGALSGSASYMTNVAFGDKDFSVDDLITNTMTSAVISGTVGGAVGSGVYGLDKTNIAKVASDAGQILKDSTTSSARKILGQAERDIINA